MYDTQVPQRRQQWPVLFGAECAFILQSGSRVCVRRSVDREGNDVLYFHCRKNHPDSGRRARP